MQRMSSAQDPPTRAHAALIGRDRPLCFLHIAKTGGTSLTDAIGRLYPPGSTFSEAGNLSVEYLQGLGERLNGQVFLAGHAGPGVAEFLKGRADIITLLRQPADQAVSNYLHVLSDPENPLHGAAIDRSFADFLRGHSHQIDYQTRALCVALSADPARMDQIRTRRLEELLGFLDSLAFAGVVERAEACGEVLTQLLESDRPIALACLNPAILRGVSTRTLGRLRREYETLCDDPELAPIFMREARVHARAASILDRLEQREARRQQPARRSPSGRFVSARRFSTSSGRFVGPAIIANLHETSAHLVHGPEDRLPTGHHRVEFHVRLRDCDGSGRIEIEALANRRLSLGRRWLSVTDLASSRLRKLDFAITDPSDVMEFRVRARYFATGVLVFEGVTVRRSTIWRTWPSMVRRWIWRFRLRMSGGAPERREFAG